MVQAVQTPLFTEHLPRWYAGVGSRLTPPEVQRLMTQCASRLEADGWHLRSGGAKGADRAFEAGVHESRNRTIFFPSQATEKAIALATSLHPAPAALNDFAKRAHGRNAMIIAGADVERPRVVSMVLLWAPYEPEKGRPFVLGGTGGAVRLALHFGVPPERIFNLYDVSIATRVRRYVEGGH